MYFSTLLKSMKSGIKCIYTKIRKKTDVRRVILLVLAVWLLIEYWSYFINVPKTNPNKEVEGWEKFKSRHASDYVLPGKLTTMTFVNQSCKMEKPLMLIIVCSEIGHAKRRKAIRETWAVIARKNKIIVLFLMGVSADRKLDVEILQESLSHGDIIVENFIDTYNNLTLKSIMMLKWIKENCLESRFIMKMDDDVYINVNNLLNLIKPIKDDELPELLLGKLYTRERPHRSLSSKWFMPKYMFADDFYPHYLCGVGYIMSSEVVKKLYAESLKNPLVYLEDLFITGICAKTANIQPIDHLGFHFFEHSVNVECNSIHAHLILLSHHLSIWQIRDQHEQMLKCWRQNFLPSWINEVS